LQVRPLSTSQIIFSLAGKLFTCDSQTWWRDQFFVYGSQKEIR
jgi:hypothetical protein